MLKTPSKQYKFVLVGDSSVGKSSLLNRFIDKTFSESFFSTIGVDFKFKVIQIQNKDIKLQIWDTAGQQIFRSIVSAYYANADAIIIVYDINSYESFDSVKTYWIDQAQNNNKNNAKIFLIGNKLDQQNRRQVQKFTINAFMQEHAIDGAFEASAKTGQNVDQSFGNITKSLYFGTPKKSLFISSQNKISAEYSKKKATKRSMHQQQPMIKKQQPDEYQEILQIGEEARDEKIEIKQNQSRIKINQETNNKKSKNPNYNKSCCLK